MTDARLAPVLRHLRRLTRPEDPSDATLLEQFAADRDASALGELVRRHGPLVWRVCRRMLPHMHDAEDAFQATFLALARRASAIRRPGSLASWLHAAAFRIARRLRHDAGRRVALACESAAVAADPAHEAGWRELRRIVEEEVAALPQKYRLPLLLCYWEGRSNDEAARQLGCPAGTVKTRLAKARQLLHDRLTRRGVALPAGVAALLLAPGPGDATVPAMAVTASTRVVALSEVVGRTLIPARRPFVAALVLAVGLTVAGVLAFPTPPQQTESSPAAKPDPARQQKRPPRVDRFGDPLPERVVARLGTMRLRHGNGTTLAFAPDGKSILTFGGDRTLRTWDMASGRLLEEQRLPGKWWLTPDAVLSPDGRLLAFQDDSEWGRHFFLWDVAGQRLLRKFELRGGRQRMAFSPDGKTLVTGDDLPGGAVRAWDVDTGQARLLGPMVAGPPQLSLGDLFFAGNGTVAVSTKRQSKALQVWDVKAGRELSRLAVPEDTLGAALSPDGRVVVSWRYSDKGGEAVQLWDVATGKPPKGLTVPRLTLVPTARFAPDGKTLWIGTGDGILVWDPAAGKAIRTLPGGAGFNLTFSPDGKTSAALGRWGGRDPYSPVVRIWDVATGALHPANATGQGHLEEVDAIAFAPDGRTIASASNGEKSVRLWDASTGKLLRSLPVNERMSMHAALAFSPDGRHLFLGLHTAVARWDVATGRETARFHLSEPGEDRRYLLVMHLAADGRSLWAFGWNDKATQYRLSAWDVTTGRRLRSVPLSMEGRRSTTGESLLGTRFSGDGRLFALPGGSVRDTATGEEFFHLSVEQGQWLQEPIAFSPDGALVAAAVGKKHERPRLLWPETFAVQVYETATLLPIVRLASGDVGHLAFTADGRRLLSAGREALAMWELNSGKELARRTSPTQQYGEHLPSFASSLAVAADGRTVVTGHFDGTALVWDLSPPAPQRPAVPVTASEREAMWVDLAGADAGHALRAVAGLADSPQTTVTMLRERLRPAKRPPAEEVRRLIAELEAPRFETRDVAARRLAELGEGAHAALRKTLSGQPSLEVRRRIEPLLDRPFLVRGSEARRALRAVRVLEGIGTPEARQVLQSLAKGADGMRLTDEAQAALQRLARRP